MAENQSNNRRDTFQTKILPIMEQVKSELQKRQTEEYSSHASGLGAFLASFAGPDGGIAATTVHNDSILQRGEWNQKTVEDYIEMVKAELKKQHIEVDAVVEKQMVDYMIRQKMPQSSSEYIMMMAAEGTLFYLPYRNQVSSLQDHIDKEGAKMYDPSMKEVAAGGVLSWTANAASTMGTGGFWGQVAIDAAIAGNDSVAVGSQENYFEKQKQMAMKEVEEAEKTNPTIPRWMFTQMGIEQLSSATDNQLAMAMKWAHDNAKLYRSRVQQAVENGERTVKASGKTTLISVTEATVRAKEYDAFAAALQGEQENRKSQAQDEGRFAYHTTAVSESEEPVSTMTESPAAHHDQTSQSSEGNYSGWNGLASSLGLSGFEDTFKHLGVTLASLPDMLVGIFTGKTKSLGLNAGTMLPLAAIVCGTFTKNPLLKFPLMLLGGASLLNRASKEALSDYRQEKGTASVRFKQYDEEPLNPRITNPHIEGNVLILDIDRIPRIITLPPATADAYQKGALPLNILANHVLAKADQMAVTTSPSLSASQQFEQNQEHEQSRGIR